MTLDAVAPPRRADARLAVICAALVLAAARIAATGIDVMGVLTFATTVVAVGLTYAPRPLARAAGAALVPFALMVLGTRLAWPEVQAEVYLIGLVSGLVIGLIALALVIVYRANRIVNFAAADMGAAPAALVFMLYAAWGWNWWLVSAMGVVCSVLVGVLVEFLFLRRFFKAPRLIMTVATIGVAQLFIFLGFLIPTWFSEAEVNRFPAIVSAQFTVGNAVFGGSDINVFIVVPIVLVGLMLFFRYSATGVAVRATAESADRAALLGIPVRRLQSVVWGIAGLLAFLAIYLRYGYQAQNLGSALDPTLLLTALGAAVIGRMERMPTVVLAAVGLNIVDSAAFTHFASQSYGIAIRAGIIAIALVVQHTDMSSRLANAATSTWQATQEIRRIPAELRADPTVRNTLRGLWLVGLVAVVAIPQFASNDVLNQTTLIAIYAIIGLSLVVLTGWAGQVSLGQMAFVGLSGAVAGTLAEKYHWDVGLILLAAGATGAVLTILVGLPTLRARGLAFAIMTLAFAVMTSNYLLNRGYSPIKGWLPGGSVRRTNLFGVISLDSELRFFYFTVVILGVSMAMMYSLRRSRIGRVLIGVRDNEKAAQAYAVGARASLIMSFGISGFLAGIAGALFVLQQGALDAPNFSAPESLRVFSLVVVGGLGSIGGVILGASFVKGTQYFMPAPWDFLASGMGLLVVLLVLPGGLGAAVGQARDAALRWHAKRKGMRIPSFLADTRVESEIPAGAELAEAIAEATEHGEDIVEVVD